MKKLTPDVLLPALEKLNGWELNNDRICKDFIFSDFKQAFAFMVQVALLCEKQNHHPDWSNSYNKVSIALTTHDHNGVTYLDLQIAEAIETIKQ